MWDSIRRSGLFRLWSAPAARKRPGDFKCKICWAESPGACPLLRSARERDGHAERWVGVLVEPWCGAASPTMPTKGHTGSYRSALPFR
jgi:hypothetical protein